MIRSGHTGASMRKTIAIAICAGALALVAESVAEAQVFTQPVTSAPARKKPARKPPRAAPRPSTAAPVREQRPSTFSDPAHFCAYNPDADGPGPSYTGAAVPPWMSNLLAANRTGLPTSWRCASRRVLACSAETGAPTCTRPSQDSTPTAAMTEHCTDKKAGEIPVAITGLTVPVWTCKNGTATAIGARPGLDARGYFAASWLDVTDFAPINMIGVIPKAFAGNWTTSVQGKGFLFKIPYNVMLRVTEGTINRPAGTIQYYSQNLHGETELFCESSLVLRSVSVTGAEFDEHLTRMGQDGRCTSYDRITFRPRDGQMLLEWYKTGTDKPRMSAWAQRGG